MREKSEKYRMWDIQQENCPGSFQTPSSWVIQTCATVLDLERKIAKEITLMHESYLWPWKKI